MKNKVTKWMEDNGKKEDDFFNKLKESEELALKKAGEAAAIVKEKSDQFVEWAEDVKDKAIIIVDEADETRKKITDNIKQAKLEADKRILRPIFEEDIIDNVFDMPRMICLCEPDDKHKNNPVCVGSIGYQSSPNDMEVTNIYPGNLKYFDIKIIPDSSDGIYYSNPAIPGTYVALDKYFKYIKEEKVRELVKIAKDLGARRCIVEISEKETSGNQQGTKVAAKFGKGKIEGQYDITEKKAASIAVAANEKWKGHNNPIRPELVYFKNENHIKDLIEMRFDPTNKLESHTYEIEYSSSASIKTKEAAKIDGALKVMKYSMSESMSLGVEKSERTYFRYTIEFEGQ